MDVADWLRAYLKDGEKEVSEIRAAAKAAGYSRFALREARRICFIRVTNNGSRDRPKPDKWFWILPEAQQ